MGGKKNKSKKFLRQRFNKKHNKQNKKKNSDKHIMTPSPSKQDTKNTKKSRELFNAGINALNEQPEVDVGLMYNKSDGYIPENDILDGYSYNNNNNNNNNDNDDNISISGGDHGSDDWSDVMSLQSEVTILDDEILNLQDNDHLIDNELDDLLDDLCNKDSNIRIQSLNKLNNELRTRRTNGDDFTDKNQRLTIISKNLANCIRKGSVNEQLHALDTIGLLALSINDGINFFIKYHQTLIKNLIQRPKSAVVQIKAINIWATMVWSVNDSNTKIASIKLFEYFWNYNLRENENENDRNYNYYNNDNDDNDDDNDDDDVDDDEDEEKEERGRVSTDIMVSALDAWLFLITSIGSSSDIGSLLDTYCPSLLQLLRLESSTVREKIHIGKALTVLINNYNTAIEQDTDFEEQDVNLDAIMNEFNHLKSNTKQHRKKEFLNQKCKFRDYLKTLDSKWTPLIVIKLHHKKFELNGWNQWVQYHYIKKVLLNGLQAHLLQNNKIKETFQIEIDAEPITLSKTEKKNKKQQNIENQRNTKKDRGKKRDNKRGFMFDKTLIE